MLLNSLIAQAEKPFGEQGFVPPTQNLSDKTDAVGILQNVELMISRGITLLTIVAGLFFIVYFFLGAFYWISAGGDSGKVQKARDQMVNAVLGLIVVVAAYGLIGLIGTAVGLRLLNPAEELYKLVPRNTGQPVEIIRPQ